MFEGVKPIRPPHLLKVQLHALSYKQVPFGIIDSILSIVRVLVEPPVFVIGDHVKVAHQQLTPERF